MSLACDIVRRGLRRALRAPGPIATLYAFNLALTAALGAFATWRIRTAFADYPPLDLQGWVVTLRADPQLGRALARAGGIALGATVLLASIVAAVALRHLAGKRRDLGIARAALQLALLDLLSWIARLLSLGAWVISAYGLHRWSSAWQLENWLVTLHTLTALPFVALLALLSLLRHHAQPLLVAQRRSAWSALAASLRLTRRWPAAAVALWAAYWSLVVATTVAAFALHDSRAQPVVASAGAQILVASKSLLITCSWCCSMALAKADGPKAGAARWSTRSVASMRRLRRPGGHPVR